MKGYKLVILFDGIKENDVKSSVIATYAILPVEGKSIKYEDGYFRVTKVSYLPDPKENEPVAEIRVISDEYVKPVIQSPEDLPSRIDAPTRQPSPIKPSKHTQSYEQDKL